MDREQTLSEAMNDLQVACGRLMIALLLDAMKLAFLPVRFFLWLNGDK